MKRIINRFRVWLRPLLCRWFSLPTPDQVARLECGLERAQIAAHRLIMASAEREKVHQSLRAQIVQLRVQQSATSRAGWAVMCFIPEETVKAIRKERETKDTDHKFEAVVTLATKELVRLALAGVVRVDSQGKVCALVFEPLDMRHPARAPEYVQAVFDNDGKYRMSEKAWDRRTEEQRVKSAAGVGGFGV